jgi:hypothetical protein
VLLERAAGCGALPPWSRGGGATARPWLGLLLPGWAAACWRLAGRCSRLDLVMQIV